MEGLRCEHIQARLEGIVDSGPDECNKASITQCKSYSFLGFPVPTEVIFYCSPLSVQ